LLGRHHSSIADEVKNNSVRGRYIAHKAQHKSYVNRLHSKKNLKKIRCDDKLEEFVREKIKDDRSPEIVAGRWNDTELERISTVTIYKYIYSRFAYDLLPYLYSNRKRRRKR
jgi:IS30 family transposase